MHRKHGVLHQPVAGLEIEMTTASEIYPQYTVMADRDTGEWLGDAEFVDYVTRDDWNAKTDTDNAHFDTYEVNNETRAIEVVWTK